MSHIDIQNNRPLLLSADNFTPPSRTPWGGTKIISKYKSPDDVSREHSNYSCVGESWEVSVEPDFPSRTPDGTDLGAELIRRRGRSTPLLVKLLDAADELSVQIHPSDDYPGLAPDEAGKPESWYVLEAEPGAGLYIGLRDGVTLDAIRAALVSEGDLSTLMEFVPVTPGDFFLIEAGTPHAIGRGVTLIEPQYVTPGRKGVTYRYWDWNRRYDAAGRLDANGIPRALHVQNALAVTNEEARGPRFIESIRAHVNLEPGPARFQWLAGKTRAGALACSWFEVGVLQGSGVAPALSELSEGHSLTALVVVEGEVVLERMGAEPVRVGKGRSVVVPDPSWVTSMQLSNAHAVVIAEL